MKTGPIELRGSMYLIGRDAGPLGSPDFLGGARVARLSEVLSYKLGSRVSIKKKANISPAMARITGDWIELDGVFSDFTEELLQVITNKRNSGTNFTPGSAGPKSGHVIREDEYNAIIIRDEQEPLNFPALYIPFALVPEVEYLSARVTKHVELCNVYMTSVDFQGTTEEGVEIPPFEYGDITQFSGYQPPEEPTP